MVDCVGYDVTVVKTGFVDLTITRDQLTLVVIAFDIAVCIVFTIWTGILDDQIHKEKIRQDEDHV